MEKFTTINLNKHFNAPARLGSEKGRKKSGWHSSAHRESEYMPRGRNVFWGIPFLLGPENLAKKGLVVVGGGQTEVRIALRGKATHICLLHFCNLPSDLGQSAAGGERLASSFPTTTLK